MNQVPFRVIMLRKTDLKLDLLSFLTLTEPDGLNCLVSIITQVIIRDKRETHRCTNCYFVDLRHNVLCT